MNILRGPAAFSLQEPIGEGGFCRVFRATDLRSGRTVAVKCLLPGHRNAEQEECLRREFLLLARLSHPNIVSAVDFYHDDDLGPVAVLEHVSGQPFAPTTPLSLEDLSSAIAQLCRALNFLHARGLVHGDLKPENVLIVRHERNPQPTGDKEATVLLKLLDLGLAVRIRGGSPLPRRGTPSYVAPEVLCGMPADHRADLYSLGTLIAQNIEPHSPRHGREAGRGSGTGGSDQALLDALWRLTEHLREADPSRRPSSAAEVLEVLRAEAAGGFAFETQEGRLATLESIELVGRDRESGQLLYACGVSSPGPSPPMTTPSVFLVYGEAGIGKTRFVRNLCDLLKARSIPYHLGTCSEKEGSTLETLRILPTSASPEGTIVDCPSELDRREDRYLDQLDRSVWAQFHRHRRLDDIAERFCRAIRRRYRVLIVEDLHRADEETFDVVLRIAARAQSSGFVLLATFRTEGLLAQRLERLVESHVITPHSRPLALSRLTPSETEEFILHALGPHRDAVSLAAMAHRIAGGNPLFLQELLRGMIEAGHISGGPFRWKVDLRPLQTSGVPLTLRDLVRRRLGELPPSEASLLEWFAAFGQPTNVSLLHEACGLPYAELRFLLESIVRRGLLSRERGEHEDTFTFSHNLFAEGVYESIPPLRRADLHRGVAVALERTGSTNDDEHVTRLAHHFLRAGEPTKGPRYALEAASRAERRGTTHRAISLYHSCLNFIASDQIDLRYETLQRLAYLLRRAGDVQRAETFYFELLLAARNRRDPRNQAVALTQLGRIRADRGELDEAAAFAARAVEMNRAVGDADAEAEATLLLAYAARRSGDSGRALELARRAEELAHGSGSFRVLAYATNELGLVLMALRRFEEAYDRFSASLHISEASEQPNNYLIALGNTGWVHLERGALHDAAEVFARCITGWTAQGYPHGGPAVFLNAGEVDRLRGAFESSRTRLQAGLAAAERTERNELVHYAVYSLALLDLEEGALGEAEANLVRAYQVNERSGAKAAAALSLVALGDLDVQLGHLSAAESSFGRAAEVAQIVRDDLIRSGALAGLAETWARAVVDGAPALGERASAPATVASRTTASADEAYDLALKIGSKQAMVRADLAGALAYMAAGDPDTALLRARRAEELAQECGLRPDKARALLAQGMIHASSGRMNEAAACLEESRALADEMGLRAVEARACAEISGVARARFDAPTEVEVSQRAAAILHDMARTLPEPEDRDRFMSVPWRRRVIERAAAARASASEALPTSEDEDADRRRSVDPGPERVVDGSPDGTSSDRSLAAGTVVGKRQEDKDARSTSTGLYGESALSGPGRSDSHTVPGKASLPGGSPESETAPSAQGGTIPAAASAVDGSGVVPDQDGTTAGAADLRSAVTLLLEEALRSITCDRGLVLLIAPDGSSEIVVARGLESESIQDARSYCRGVVDRAAQGEEVLVVDTSRDERFRDRRSVSLFNIVSIICLPLRFGSKVVGALYLDSRAGSRLLRDAEFAAARRVAARMTSTIQAAWEQERRHEEALLKQKALCQAYRLDAITGESAAMKKVFRVLEAVIASDCNVLVVGESGTGKELAARAIHFSGRRKMAPFVPLDCGALPDSLVESELFGYRKGAFTGADTDRQGLFEEADGGTLFLDEITNTSTVFQGKLLRVLQTGEFRRVGDPTPRKVDVRIIAATNMNLEEAMRAGRFREDLYYRLNVVTVQVPPLRERREDVPALAEQFARAFCEKEKIAFRGIGESALARLCEHTWPGNVRELKNAVESALILSRDGAVRREFLPESVRGGSFGEIRRLLRDGTAALAGRSAASETGLPHPEESSTGSSSDSVAQGRSTASAGPAGAKRPEGWMTESERRALKVEEDRSRILDALARAAGDKSLAAEILGCSRMTLYRRMRRLGIAYSNGRGESTSID